MCGFAGEYVFAGGGRADLAVAEAMAARLIHRGPDEPGRYLSGDGRCAIGFRRLAIIDPPGSHQPMVSADGLAVVAFNGEIYNFRDLRRRLADEGVAWRTAGDTEVLCELYRRRGQAMLDEIEGMFAIALHDVRRGGLLLARDRLGEKPLWLARLADRVVFASEAKALLTHPLVSAEVDPSALAWYLTLGYIPAPRSIWRGITKLPPAHALWIDGDGERLQRYWSLPETSESPREASRGSGGTPHAPAIVEEVREALTRSVSQRMVADVPVGALLSGGVDSSIVAALMCRSAGAAGGVRTFTAGFEDGKFDERPFAASVARRLGTDHRELAVSAGDAAGLLDRLIGQYDEPFADSSALPTYLICRAAREHVTVALTGDGGDEAFGGYERYRAMRLAETLGGAGRLAAALVASAAALLAPHDERNRLRRMIRFAAALRASPAERYFRYRRLFSPEHIAELLTVSEPPPSGGGHSSNAARHSSNSPPRERGVCSPEVPDFDAPAAWFRELYDQGRFDDAVAAAQRHDLLTYLPDDLLVKADIASMASSLELRSPMLDHHVVTLGLCLPPELKWRGRRGKAVLADAFGDLLPPGVFTRRKTGFGAPIGRWLREDLRQALRETLLDGPLVTDGWMNRSALERLIADHHAGRADHRHRLWALLWLGRWMANR